MKRSRDRRAERVRGARARRRRSRPSVIEMSTAPPAEDVRPGEHSHRHAPAEGAAASVMGNTAPAPKAIALVLLRSAGTDARVRVLYVGALHEPTPHHVPLAVVGPAAVAAQLGSACPAIRLMHARRRLVQMRCRRSTIARSTVPMRQPRTACSSRRPPTVRPPSRWKKRSTASPPRRAERPSVSPTSSRCRLGIPMAPQRSTR